jgi:molybdopterin molybdotransferase
MMPSMVLSLAEAYARVLAETRRVARPVGERVDLGDALCRVLHEKVLADRDQPPFHRSTRDGFAVRAEDLAALPARLTVVGEVAAGRVFAGHVGASQCVEIMTGAPLPEGANAVVMVETTERSGAQVLCTQRVAEGENVVLRGSELAAGETALPPGTYLTVPHIALLASLGCARVKVAAKPRVAIVATGDELVDVGETPGVAQIRNSNAYSLAAQVRAAGGLPHVMPIAGDREDALTSAFEQALAEAEVVLLSGGVSMGKYDLVETVLARRGATVVFDGVAIRPGKPVVFGHVEGKLLFGLPGNPLSTLVTFELFVRPALALLSGCTQPARRFLRAKLGARCASKPLPLTVFQPCALEGELGEVVALPLVSKGSGDLAAMARAQAFLVLPPETAEVHSGEVVTILML